MAVKHKKAVKAKAKLPKALTPKQQTAVSAKKYGIPFWALWGIAGAESTWGEGGTNLFGLLDAAEGANVSNWKEASEQSAKTLAGLKKQYGNLSQAISHYSGYEYNASHPKQLAAESGVTPANENRVVKRELSHVKGETIPADFGLKDVLPGGLGLSLAEALGYNGPDPGGFLEETLGKEYQELGKGNLGGAAEQVNPLNVLPEAGKSLINFPSQITNAFTDFDAVAKLLTSPEFWIRVGEAIGGILLLYMALKALTGASVPGEGAAKGAAKAAAFKRLPPKQRVR